MFNLENTMVPTIIRVSSITLDRGWLIEFYGNLSETSLTGKSVKKVVNGAC